ncbi:uncharacterized protein LOC129788186 [Lutzomyia longipalpis]|uniref:Uncharacterized protein n=1 Tax=Lutzomyia longipalpis TaxID=7200 RepID=A0A1B0CEF8_LUTLO|nr:uncharacterized protein LOC129788186 [Lutzomyia longipalpis]
MNKLVLFAFLFTAVIASSNAQFFGGFFPGEAGGFAGGAWPQFVVDKVVQQVRDTPVTEEQKPQLDQIVQDLENGLAQCDELLTVTPVYWLYKRCVGFQLKKATNAAAALQAAAATTTAPPSF